jgi:hypothetical protein
VSLREQAYTGNRRSQPVSPATWARGGAAARAAATDLGFVLAVFVLCSAALPWLDPVLRRGRGAVGVLALAGYQFACEGLAPFIVLVRRRESGGDYGFTRRNVGRSIGLALLLACVYDAALSWHAGTILWLPFARQPAAKLAMRFGLVGRTLGVALTIGIWGMVEGFFGVFFARKVNTVAGHSGRGWYSPGALTFAVFNGLIHVIVGQGWTGFVESFASGYAIGAIPAITGNAWGSTLFQSFTNAVGRL